MRSRSLLLPGPSDRLSMRVPKDLIGGPTDCQGDSEQHRKCSYHAHIGLWIHSNS